MIVAGSRYEGADVLRVVAQDGSEAHWVAPPRTLDAERDLGSSPVNITLQSHAPLDVVALRVLGREEAWDVLVDLNPSVFADFDTLVESILQVPAGTSMLVPRPENVRTRR